MTVSHDGTNWMRCPCVTLTCCQPHSHWGWTGAWQSMRKGTAEGAKMICVPLSWAEPQPCSDLSPDILSLKYHCKCFLCPFGMWTSGRSFFQVYTPGMPQALGTTSLME
jgi:hypothetical protein